MVKLSIFFILMGKTLKKKNTESKYTQGAWQTYRVYSHNSSSDLTSHPNSFWPIHLWHLFIPNSDWPLPAFTKTRGLKDYCVHNHLLFYSFQFSQNMCFKQCDYRSFTCSKLLFLGWICCTFLTIKRVYSLPGKFRLKIQKTRNIIVRPTYSKGKPKNLELSAFM